MRKIALALAWIALCCAPTGCNPQPRSTTPDAVRIDAPAASAQPAASTPAQPQVAVVGGWESAACGDRKYVRKIGFEADGTFAATDLVSPCPAGARCVWSGIILWTGTWKVQNGRVLLQPDRSGRLPDKVPSDLMIVQDNPVYLAEPGDTGCQYRPAR